MYLKRFQRSCEQAWITGYRHICISGNRSWAATRFFLYINDLPAKLRTGVPEELNLPVGNRNRNPSNH